jgi:hypothetical protein
LDNDLFLDRPNLVYALFRCVRRDATQRGGGPTGAVDGTRHRRHHRRDGHSGRRPFARKRGWLGENESFELETVADSAREEAASLASAASFEPLRVGHHASSGAIGSRLRRLVRDLDPDVVGSENAGHQMNAVGSVAFPVIGSDSYDVLVVRHVRE